jgi:hypothetical protein
VDASVGSVGPGYDNARAKSTIGLYKTEKIDREGPWRTLAEIELGTLEWVDWYNHTRLHSACGGLRRRWCTRRSAAHRRPLWPRKNGTEDRPAVAAALLNLHITSITTSDYDAAGVELPGAVG